MAQLYEIKRCIERQLEKGNTKFIIFPFGDIGMQVNNILKDAYGISPAYILDNHLSKYNPNIKPLTFLKEINCEEYILLLASTDPAIYIDLKQSVLEYLEEDHIVELNSMKAKSTKVGKYSYGPLCDHWLVESVGAFCSFAVGTDVVPNHAMGYLSTHPFIYTERKNNPVFEKIYDDRENMQWIVGGVFPQRTLEMDALEKKKIGNDVWLGKNVIITNGANIGNGVIAGAGSIITKDIPDYAVVVGAPARIIRYRYTPDQIDALNKIQWWNWSNQEIRERYDDFYIPIEQFIEKYNS